MTSTAGSTAIESDPDHRCSDTEHKYSGMQLRIVEVN
jgi:hypothetical protein